MKRNILCALIGPTALIPPCGDNFLTGGELSNDPNRATQATSGQLLTGIESATWALLQSDPARISGLWSQQLQGVIQQYFSTYNYDVSPQTTNGFQSAIYTGGGLVDIRKLEAQTIATHDTVFLGIAQVMEGLVMGTAADMFGNITYSHALTGELNPPLDPQLAVYDSVQAVLSRAIVNLQAKGPTNFGPGSNDLSYGGDP